MEEIKYFKVEVPKGYEIDKENSTWDNICFKKIEQKVRTWEDLISNTKPNGCKYVTTLGDIEGSVGIFSCLDRNVFIDEKHAKSALAMAQISQLLPFFGGAITDEEWEDARVAKYTIFRTTSGITKGCSTICCDLLAFHTEEQRDNFLKYNERLVNDYLMID